MWLNILTGAISLTLESYMQILEWIWF